MVEIQEEQSNYNKFDLIVEIGSSLGLWIGLSVLGIFDVMSDCSKKGVDFVKEKMENKENAVLQY